VQHHAFWGFPAAATTLLLLIMAGVYIGGDLQGPPGKNQSKTKMEESR
jgi:hypothetical protein